MFYLKGKHDQYSQTGDPRRRNVHGGGTGLRFDGKTASIGEYVDDTVITGKVKTGFFNEPALKSAEINIETFKGNRLCQFTGRGNEGGRSDRHGRRREVGRERHAAEISIVSLCGEFQHGPAKRLQEFGATAGGTRKWRRGRPPTRSPESRRSSERKRPAGDGSGSFCSGTQPAIG